MTLRVLLTMLLFGSPAPGTETEPSNARALNVLFGDEYLAENVRDVCSRAATLPAEDRYASLTDWVLPADGHSFRLNVDFTPTYPPPPVADPPIDTGRRVPAGGDVISPAVDLIDAAATLGRLEELRQRVEAATTDSVWSRIDRLALLTLIDMTRDDLTSARTHLAEVFTLVLSEEIAAVPRVDALLLCVHEAASHPSLCQPMLDPTYRFTRRYQTVVDRTTWQRQFTAASARVKHVAETELDAAAGDGDSMSFIRWFPASLPQARSRGAGAPPAQWHMAPGYVENLSSHDEDYLYYAVPLRGNFEVECDVGMFGWNECEIFLCGKWLRAVHDHKSFKVGGLGGMESINRIPPLTKGKESIHYRSVIRNGALTTFLHGRRIYDLPLSEEHDPWLAIHSALRHDGPVYNLRLTGSPVIPDELRLGSNPDLDAWIPYFDEVVGVDWRYTAGEIRADRRSEIPTGCCQESVLFYHRPMLEDGSIEYEFWYDEGASEAHPTLDRLCFLISPQRVAVHWLTDGLYDRTGLTPDNLFDEPDNRRGTGPLPLHQGGWNRLRLTVRDDRVDLLLNGEIVCQRDIEPTNQRHFGLFHYADQTDLRVRNVNWTGDWPHEVPDLDAQELAVDETRFLDERLPELTAVFSHDFTDGLPEDRFGILERESPEHTSVTFDGLHTTRPGNGEAFVNTTVAPALVVSGDFDITASFTQFVTVPAETGSNSIFLMAVAETADHCRLFRRHLVDSRRLQQVKQLIVCSVTERNGERFSFFSPVPMEAPSGTLRLARRGATVYYLWAENDSLQFRLIDQESFPADDLPLYGVRLKVQTQGEEGMTSATWKNLTVRAERLSGPAVDNASPFLNSNREQ